MERGLKLKVQLMKVVGAILIPIYRLQSVLKRGLFLVSASFIETVLYLLVSIAQNP